MHAVFRAEIMQGIFHNFRASYEARILLLDQPPLDLGQRVDCEVLAAARVTVRFR
jgi:hypothetical protein